MILAHLRRRREAFRREVVEEVERFLWRAGGDQHEAWWAAQRGLAELRYGSRAWRVRRGAVSELEGRRRFVVTEGADSATRRLMAVAALPALIAASVYVVDGDTLRLGNERIRLANIDAPETGERARCPAERNLARLATERLRGLTRGQHLDVRRQGTDRYGRTLARVRVNGRDLGDVLVAEGLAGPWAGRRIDWCAARR